VTAADLPSSAWPTAGLTRNATSAHDTRAGHGLLR
jgi:hypothetical protein